MLLFPAAILTISDESDRDFMKHLYINHAAWMFRVARAMTDSKQDAEDVVGEACVALIRKISLLRTLERNVLRRFCRRLRMMRQRRMRGFCSNAR